MTKPLLGIRFSPLTAEEIASEVCSNDPVGAFRMIATANIDHIANLSMNPEFRAAYADAWLATIDGTPVLDVKPWMDEFAPIGATRQPAWATELMQDYYKD